MQILDPVALKEDLLRSLLYQHTQPPLFNAFLGLILKLTPGRAGALVAFRSIYFIMGFFLVAGIYHLSLGIGATRPSAFAAAAAFVFWPPNTWEHVFFHPPSERWLSYDYPVAVLLLSMAIFLVLLRDKGKTVYAAAFILFSAALVLTRSMFHLLLWAAPTIIALAWYGFSRKGIQRRALVMVSVLAVLLAGFPYIKNARLTGWFTSSTLQGMNLASRTLYVPGQRIENMVVEGSVTPLALIPRFSAPETYIDYYRETRKTGIPVLDNPRKYNHNPNFNHFIISRASRETQANTMVIAAANPGAVFRSMVNGIYIFFGFQPNQYLWKLQSPPWGYWNVNFPPLHFDSAIWPVRYIVGPVLFAVVFFGVIVLLMRRYRDPACVFMAFSLIYVFTLSTLVELGNNCIFRKQVDPFLFSGAALGATLIWRRLRAGGRRSSPDALKTGLGEQAGGTG
jgi:hypothetical protein